MYSSASNAVVATLIRLSTSAAKVSEESIIEQRYLKIRRKVNKADNGAICIAYFEAGRTRRGWNLLKVHRRALKGAFLGACRINSIWMNLSSGHNCAWCRCKSLNGYLKGQSWVTKLRIPYDQEIGPNAPLITRNAAEQDKQQLQS